MRHLRTLGNRSLLAAFDPLWRFSTSGAPLVRSRLLITSFAEFGRLILMSELHPALEVVEEWRPPPS